MNVCNKKDCYQGRNCSCNSSYQENQEKNEEPNEYTVIKPDGVPYCNFSVSEKLFTIGMLEGSDLGGYDIHLDVKILPVLKKFLDSLEPPKEVFENNSVYNYDGLEGTNH